MRKRDVVALFAALVLAGLTTLNFQYTRMKVGHAHPEELPSFSEQLRKDSARVGGLPGTF